MKIYVINLVDSTKRLRKMKQRLDSFGLRYEVIKAVSAADIDSDLIVEINKSVPRGGPVKPGEVACAFSHSKALRKMLDDEEEVGIILEDDVVLGRRFTELVRSISPASLKHGPLLLGALFFKPTSIHKIGHLWGETNHYSVEQLENAWGAMAYAVKRDDAEPLSAQMSYAQCRSDDWFFYVKTGVINNITLCFPFVIKHEELNSDIAKFEHTSRPLSISRISGIIHRYRIFPLFQVSIAWRQRRAEKRQSSNIIIEKDGGNKTYRLN